MVVKALKSFPEENKFMHHDAKYKIILKILKKRCSVYFLTASTDNKYIFLLPIIVLVLFLTVWIVKNTFLDGDIKVKKN